MLWHMAIQRNSDSHSLFTSRFSDCSTRTKEQLSNHTFFGGGGSRIRHIQLLTKYWKRVFVFFFEGVDQTHSKCWNRVLKFKKKKKKKKVCVLRLLLLQYNWDLLNMMTIILHYVIPKTWNQIYTCSTLSYLWKIAYLASSICIHDKY